MLGGMRAVTWTQVAQYIVLIIAYLIPAIWMSTVKTGIPIPQLMQGQALQNITALEAAQGIAVGHITPFVHGGYNALNFFLLILCLMVGTASLPHVLMRYFTTPSVREARVSVAWSLLFIFILYFTAPAYAAFAKWTMLDLVASGLTPDNIAEKAGWMMRWAAADNTLVQICGKAAVDAAAIAAACAEQGVTNIGFANINLNADMIVLATPEMAGMPYVISGLVAAGGLAAALSTADGLLLAIANALSHDIYYKMIDQNAPTARRLIVSRVLLVRGGHRGGLCRLDQAVRHPGDGVLGVLACGGGPLPGAGARRLVEARQLGGRGCRHDRRLRPLPLLPARHPLRRGRLRRDVERPVDSHGRAACQVRGAQGRLCRCCSRRPGGGLDGARQACADDRELVAG